jgi:hypothetical protein
MMQPSPIRGAWWRFLIELQFARDYTVAASIEATGPTIRNPILETLLPSLLHIKAVAILDAALKEILSAKSLVVPKRYGGMLKGRIDFLADQGLLPESGDLHRIRDTRNDVAHEFDERIEWAELDHMVSSLLGPSSKRSQSDRQRPAPPILELLSRSATALRFVTRLARC